MKLYTTPTSPYGRIARIVILEKNLADRVEVLPAATRQEGSPYYAVNPSGRVPFLVTGDGVGIEDSALIAEYLDLAGDGPALSAPPLPQGLETRRQEAMARSMLDGIALWGREYLYRPAEARSQTIIAHERDRALRMADAFEALADGPVLAGPFNMAQATLAATLHGRHGRPDGFDWRAGRPRLSAWVDRIAERPSVAATAPKPSSH